MAEPYTGGCACGAIRYDIADEPVFSNHCQCRDCQRESGAGHGSYLTFLRAKAAVQGEPRSWAMMADSGNSKRRNFCPTCGTAVFLTFDAMPEFIAIRAGSLDDPTRFKPQAVTYGVRGHAWDHLDPGLHIFDTMPQGA